MQREQLCHKNESKSQMQPHTSLSVYAVSNNYQVRMPNQTRTYVNGTNLLPSKFEKVPGRPLPPLVRTGQMVQKNEICTSFKPAKSSDRGSQPRLPVKGQHEFIIPTQNSSIQTASRVIKVQISAQCTEPKHVVRSISDCDSAKIKSKSNSSPGPRQRSQSASRLPASSSVSSDTKPRKLPCSPSVSSATRSSRSSASQHAAASKSTDTTANEQISGESFAGIAVTQNSRQRRRSSSVSSSARVPLQRINSPQTLSPLALRRGEMVNAVDDLALTEGKQSQRCSKENCLQISFSDQTAKLQNNMEQLPLAEQQHAVCSIPDVADVHFDRVKPMEKTSNHGILGGKSDDDLSVSVKTALDMNQKSASTNPRCTSLVCVIYYFLFIKKESKDLPEAGRLIAWH